MTDETYRWFVERCLKLELEIAVLKGLEAERPPIERRDLYDAPPKALRVPKSISWPRAIQRQATDEDIARMRELRQQGLSPYKVGLRVGFSEETVRRHTRDVLIEREVGR
jgi:hypothetical protein